MTTDQQELEVLEELEKLSPPAFSLFPEVIYYDRNFNEISYFEGDYKVNTSHVSFTTSEHSKFLKNVLKYQIVKGIYLFNLKEAKEYLNNLPQKSLI